MTSNKDELDKLETALFSCLRISKRPGYWEHCQKRANSLVDRPGAAILLSLSDQPCQFQALVNRLGIEPPSVSRKVHELEDEGLITRRIKPDRRVHELHLSESGNDLAKRLRQAKRALLSDVLAGWSSGDIKQLAELLTKLAQDMTNHFEPKTKGEAS